jgi:hypothetical protein
MKIPYDCEIPATYAPPAAEVAATLCSTACEVFAASACPVAIAQILHVGASKCSRDFGGAKKNVFSTILGEKIMNRSPLHRGLEL